MGFFSRLVSGLKNTKKSFSEKLKSYNSNPLLNQQAEIKNFLTNDKIEWKKDSIKKRKKVIVDFVLKNWNLNNV